MKTALDRTMVMFALLMSDKEKLQDALKELEAREEVIRLWIEEDKLEAKEKK